MFHVYDDEEGENSGTGMNGRPGFKEDWLALSSVVTRLLCGTGYPTAGRVTGTSKWGLSS